MHLLFRSFVVCFITCVISHAGIVIKELNSTSALAYASDVSSSDLINAGQSSLASALVSNSFKDFPGSGINDGVGSKSVSANTYFQAGSNFPASATYQLNLAVAPNGYDITSITSLMGWAGSTQAQANQDYTVEVRVVGSAGFRPLSHLKFTPFPAVTGPNYESKVTITEDATGVLARNVNAIRFLFADPGKSGANPGTVVREIDVHGAPSPGAPPAVAVQTVTDFSVTDNAYAGKVVNDDLVNKGRSSLSAFTCPTVPERGAGGENDGLSDLANKTAGAWYRPAQMPATLTFELNITDSPDGYVVSTIQTYAGWKMGGTQCCANQKYTVEYRKVGGSYTWLPVTTVDFSPFSSLVDTPASTSVGISAPTGNLLSGVSALRFTLQEPTRSLGTYNGTVLQEIDVIGYPVKSPK